MTRRQLIRSSVLFMFATALGKYDALAQDGGLLTVDLNQWRGVAFTFKGQKVTISTAEVFAALKEGEEK